MWLALEEPEASGKGHHRGQQKGTPQPRVVRHKAQRCGCLGAGTLLQRMEEAWLGPQRDILNRRGTHGPEGQRQSGHSCTGWLAGLSSLLHVYYSHLFCFWNPGASKNLEVIYERMQTVSLHCKSTTRHVYGAV